MARKLCVTFRMVALLVLAFALAACDSDGGNDKGGISGLGGQFGKLFGGGGLTPDDGTPDDGTPDDGTPDDGTPDDGGDDGGSGSATCDGVCDYIMNCIGEECAPVLQADSEGAIRSECASACSEEGSGDLAQVYDYSCADIWAAVTAELSGDDQAMLDQACSGQGFDDGGFDDGGL